MSVSRSFSTYLPYKTFQYRGGYASGLSGTLFDGAASPTVAILVGTRTASNYSTSSGSVIFYSTNGKIWTEAQTNSFGGNAISVCAYGNNTFVAMGRGNTIATSPGTSGVTWTQRTSPKAGTTEYWSFLTFQNGLFVAIDSSGVAYTSSDGITWTQGATTITSTSKWYNDAFTTPGGVFYIENQPTSVGKWLVVAGWSFSTGSQNHYKLIDNIAVTNPTINNTISGTSQASMFPYYFPEDQRLLVKQANDTTAGRNPFHSNVSPSALTIGQPTTSAIGIAFNPIFSPAEIQTVTGTAMIFSNFRSALAVNSVSNMKRSLYFFNDGYYNILFNRSTMTDDNNVQRDLTNVAFGSDLVPVRYQTFGWMDTAGDPLANPLVTMPNAFHFKFKDMELAFMGARGTDGPQAAFLLGSPTIRPLRTTLRMGE